MAAEPQRPQCSASAQCPSASASGIFLAWAKAEPPGTAIAGYSREQDSPGLSALGHSVTQVARRQNTASKYPYSCMYRV